jgi:hypothetical protein
MTERDSLIGIDGHIYDIKNFMDKHPGEGFFGVHLHNLIGRDCSASFEKYHDMGYEILETAKREGIDKKNNVKYVCPFHFNKKIPKHFFAVNTTEREKKLHDNMYYMTPNLVKPSSEIWVVYKIDGKVYHTILQLIGKKWEYRKLDAEQFYVNVEDFIEYFEKIDMEPYR